MKKVLIVSLIFFSTKIYCQENTFTRPDYMIGFTPLKPLISSAIGFSFQKKITETTYLGLEPTIYTKIPNTLYQVTDGIKIYVSYRNYFSDKKPSGFYNQINLGGGYFSDDVTYVATYFEPLQKDYYAIDQKKKFMSLGGNLQIGYHLIKGRISVDFNCGLQAQFRILKNSITHENTEFKRDISENETLYSDNLKWGLFGPGSLVNSMFTIKYNIYKNVN